MRVDIGCVEAIFTTPEQRAPMQKRDEVNAIEGVGLEGDRYAIGTGTFSTGEKTSHITLVEAEAVEALKREDGIELAFGETRRNVVTRGVPLNHLVGCEFTVGEVRLRGDRLCEPCGYLEGRTQEGVRAGLKHRGGLRASIVGGGTIRTGDRVVRETREHDLHVQEG